MVETDLDEFIPQDEINRKYPVEGIHAVVDNIRTSISSNGNKYTAVILEDGTWLFLWWNGDEESGFEPTDWIKHVREWKNFYIGKKCDITVSNSNYYEDEEDPFYNIQTISPEEPEEAERLLKMMKKKGI